MVRRTAIVALLVSSAQVASGQIIDSGRRSFGQPEVWTSLGIGWMSHNPLCDPASSACWDFGGAPQWRASLEFPMGRGATLGGAATTARVPLVYSGGGAAGCTSCDADANISQFLGMLHIGGGTGLHQAIDLAAGATVFSNFRTTSGGTRLGPGKAVTNVSFSVAYGFGYPVSHKFHLTLQQEFGLVIGKRMPGTSNNTAEQTTLRIGARLALGG